MHDIPPVRLRQLAGREGTDLDRAEFLAEHVKGKLIYVPGPGWYHWNDTHWQNDPSQDGAVARRMAHDVSNRLLDVALDVGGPDYLDAARALRSSRHISNALAEMRAMSSIRREVDALDADPWSLNFLNGTVDLRTGEVREHRAEDLITYVIQHNYSPEADDSRWTEYLRASQPDDPEMWEFLQRLAGYGLTGSTREECLAFFYGGGRNGKGVFTETLSAIFAPVLTVQNGEFWEKSRNGRNGALIAKLHGARIVVSSEMTAARLDEAFLKSYTAADGLTANPKYKAPYDFTPTGLLIMSGNDKPTIRGTDDGIWARFRCVPWEESFVGREDHALKPDLRTKDAEGVIAWCVRGAVKWYRHGLNRPERVTRATEEYREESNPFTDWVEANFAPDPEGFVSNAEVQERGRAASPKLPGAPKSWGAAVARHFGVTPGKATRNGKQVRGIPGVRLESVDVFGQAR